MLTPPSADIRERRRGQRPTAASHTGPPRLKQRGASRVDAVVLAEGISIPKLAGLVLLVELAYVSALAFAVPKGSGAAALGFVTAFLLATVISRSVGSHQPMTANPETREPQGRAPGVTRQPATHGRRKGSDTADPRGA